MSVYLLLTCFTAFAAFFVRTGEDMRDVVFFGKAAAADRRRFLNGVCLTAIFTALFLVSSFRVGIGNDYYKYVEFVNRITFDAYVPTEPGFNALVRVCGLLFGKENYVAVFSVMAFFTVFLFLKAIYELSDDFFLSFVLFMTLGYYFQSLNTIRYYLALALALYSIRYLPVGEKNSPARGAWGRWTACVLLAALFHKSALVTLPFYFLASRRLGRRMLCGGTLLAALFFLSSYFFRDVYLKLFLRLYPSYERTGELSGGTSVANILRCIGVLLFAAFVLWRQSGALTEGRGFYERHHFYLLCAYGALLLYVFGQTIPQISRIGYYLTVTQLIFIPRLLSELPGDKARRFVGVLLCVAACGYFALFLRRARADEIGIVPYRSILFTEPRDYRGTWE